MNERWVCKRCFVDNEASQAACHQCGLLRGAEATEADQSGWSGPSGSGAATAEPAGWRNLLRFWWMPLIAIVLAVGYFANARRNADGVLEVAGTLSVTDLRPGDCFNSDEETEITDVDGAPCTEAHEYEVFAIGSHEADAYPGEAEMDGVFVSLCEASFDAFVGVPYADSELWASMITPSDESWGDGDRDFTCILYDPEDSQLTNSMEGANR